MKRIIVLIVLMMTCMMPLQASAWDYEAGQLLTAPSGRNAVVDSFSYNGTTKELVFSISRRNDSWFNIGLCSFELVFNRSFVPPVGNIHAYLIIDNETYEALDQIKNYTVVEDAVLIGYENTIKLCTYYQFYIYLFENQTVINEQSMADYLMWNHTVFNEGEEPTFTSMALQDRSSSILSESSSSSDLVVIIDYDAIIPITPSVNELFMIFLAGGIVLLIVMVCMIRKARE